MAMHTLRFVYLPFAILLVRRLNADLDMSYELIKLLARTAVLLVLHSFR